MKVLNFGSLNVDYVYQVDHIMLPGETQSSTRRNVFAGGKGLNQSVALAKAGLSTYHAGQVGNDADGEMLLRVLERDGVDCSLVNRIDGPCGHTVIQVDKNAQNCILLFGGANRCIDAAYRKKVFSQFSAGDVIVLQNEINDLDQVIDEAYEKGMRIVLNPSPFDAYLDRCDWNKVDVFFINEVEGAQISGREAAEDILAWFREHHPKALVVLTLGGAGSCCMKDGQVYQQEIVPGYHSRGGYVHRIFPAGLSERADDSRGAGAGGPGLIRYGIPTRRSRFHSHHGGAGKLSELKRCKVHREGGSCAPFLAR